MSHPVVGIAVWRRGLRTAIGDPETLHAVADAYVESVSEAGAVPIILPGSRPASEAADLLDRVDGLLLTGGGDVDPATYGADRRGSRDDDPAADRWEIALVDEARRRSLPLLAICRGMQLLNVACGGTLRQEVTAARTCHVPVTGTPEEIRARRHLVALSEDGRLRQWYGSDTLDVNSIHHQGVDRLGAGLVVEATAPDGLVEGVAADGDWFALGVQWHPERLPDHRQPLFSGFADRL